MSELIKYNYEKDFTIEIELPDCVGESDFRIDLFTKGTVVYSATKRYGEYSQNIKPKGGNKYIVALRKHGLPPGLVRVRAYYWVKNEVSPDGIMQEVLSARETGIELWEGDTTQSKRISVSIEGGANSSQGTSISEIETTYQSSMSGTVVPTGEWSTVPTTEKGSYLWSRMEIKLTNNSSRYHYSVAYQGKDSQGGVSTPIFGEMVEYKVGSVIQPTIYWNRSVSTTVEKIVYLKNERMFAARSGQDTYFALFGISGGSTQAEYQTIDIEKQTASIHQDKTFVRVNTDELYVYNDAMGLKHINEKLKIK